jgi:TonB family protein
MNTQALSLVVVLLLGVTGFAEAEQDQDIKKRALDSMLLGGQAVMLFQDFEREVQLSAAESGLSSASVALVLQDFKEANARRVLSPSEWSRGLRAALSKNNVAETLTNQLIERLRKGISLLVDTGFLEQVRTIDLTDKVVYKAGPGVTPPRPLVQPLPPYTEAARAEKIGGLILVKCVVLEDGTVANCKLIRGLGYGLDESTLLTIQNQWKFQPARRDGNPVSFEAHIEVSQRLY